jgi:RNA polymerase sigma factor (sigma-70 family)
MKILNSKSLKNQDDSYYIKKILNGDGLAYRHLVDKYKNMAFTIAFRILKNREEAEETAMDGFLKAFSSLNNFKHDANFSTWLYRIVYNSSISKVRLKRQEVVSFDDDSFEDIEIHESEIAFNMLESEDRKKYIDLALSKLTEEENILITLYYWEGNSVEDISKITDLSKSNIKVILHRSRKNLLAELQKLLKNELKEIL